MVISMNNVLRYKEYLTRIEYDAEDQVLHGKIEGISDLILFEAESAKDIEREFHEAVDDYLEFCKSVGKKPDREFSGTFNVRIEPKLHREMYMIAIQKGQTLNQTIADACHYYYEREKINKLETMQWRPTDQVATSRLPFMKDNRVAFRIN